jgi:hypothetical protein
LRPCDPIISHNKSPKVSGGLERHYLVLDVP